MTTLKNRGLPSQNKFNNSLTNCETGDEHSEQQIIIIWKVFRLNYHSFCLKGDVLLLADMNETFTN